MGVTVISGQTYTNSSTENGDVVDFGGLLVNHGTLNSASDFGTIWDFGGVDNFATIYAGGIDYVSSGGLTIGVTVSNGGIQDVYGGEFSSGIASGTTVDSGGLLEVSNWAEIFGTVVSSGGTVDVFAFAFDGLLGSGSIVLRGGFDEVIGGLAFSTQVYGQQDVMSTNGRVASAVIESGGVQNVFSGGASDNCTVASGGIVNVFSGGVIGSYPSGGGDGIHVLSGGTLNIGAGGSDPFGADIDHGAV